MGQLMQFTSVPQRLVRKGPVYIALFISLSGQVGAADCVRLVSKMTSSLVYTSLISVSSILSNFGPLRQILNLKDLVAFQHLG